jgi:selenide,water dikinase
VPSIRLTTTAKTAGCAAKLSPNLLDSVLKKLPLQDDANLLVGFGTSDDAGIYRITDELALVQTVDFFPPIVDEPFDYGKIAAANALSDIYAMGGNPLTALSLVAFPPSAGMEILEQIMRGGLSKMCEAGCTIVGGHSIRDDEPKFGYAVTGLIHPRQVWRNVGVRPGDMLLLTKPIGTGVLATALKQGEARAEDMQASIASMSRLNRDAAAALREVEAAGAPNETPVHAVTDVTGFSLLGHAREMALGSDVSFELRHSHVPLLSGALEAAHRGFLSNGLKNNREWLEGCCEFDSSVAEDFRNLLCDPQTSGGFLVAIAPRAAAETRVRMTTLGIAASEIGRVITRKSPLLYVF